MLNNNLKTLRKQKGYTQEELAARLHVSRQTISKWENGISAPDADTLIRMAELFQVTVEELLGAPTPPGDRQTEILQELENIRQHLTIRNRRLRTFWHIVTALGILLTLLGIAGAVFGFVNYHAVLNDTILSPETAAIVLSSSTSVVVKGAVRAAAGLLIVLISVLMNRKYK